MRYLTLGLYACIDCKIGENGENGGRGIHSLPTGTLYLPVLNDDDGRLGMLPYLSNMP